MRIPGWLFFLSGLLVFVGMTGLCAVASYSLVRGTVIDARESGVEVPDVIELAGYALDPPEVDELDFNDYMSQRPLPPEPTDVPAFTAFLADQPAPTNTPQPGETLPPPTPTPLPDDTPEPTVAVPATEAGPTELPTWEDPRRITVLLMGVDQRSSEFDREDAHRTDTMILVQVDPVDDTIGLLSIPRDLWVRIPGFQSGRITTANYLGDLNELPGGGPQLAMDTVRANLGVSVDKYVRINFEVFEEVVDILAPEGVEICVEEPIFDPDFPDEGFGFIEVRFEPGCQMMRTEQLLQYARTRATDGGDFDRNRRQQQVLRALQEHLLSAGGITRFASQIPALYNELAASYETNFSVEEVLALGSLVSQISTDDINSGSINALHVTFDQTDEGDQILLPRQNAIADAVRQAFDPPRDLTLAELRERADLDNVRIVVYNNTSIRGLAGDTSEWLRGEHGIDVEAVGNIDPPQGAVGITIRTYTGQIDAARYLAALLGLPDTSIVPGDDGLTSADVMIVVGSDAQALISAPGAEGATP